MNGQFIVIFILFLMTLSQLATDIYLSSIPFITSELSSTIVQVQMTFSTFFAGFAISQIIYGPLSDEYGRKPFIIIGVAIYFLMSIIAAWTDSITVLLIARGVQGLGAGACSVIPRAIMQDCFVGKELEKMAIYQSMTWSIVPVTAPLLGSYIQHYLGWRYNFVFLIIVSGLALIMCFMFKETNKKPDKNLKLTTVLKDYKSIIIHEHFFPYLICALGVIMLLTGFNISAPVIIQVTLGLSALQYGWSILVVAISYVLGTVLARFLLEKITSLEILKYGLILVLISCVSLLLATSFGELSLIKLLLPILALQLGCAFIFPSSAAKTMALFPEMAGKAAAVFGCCIFLGGTVSSTVVSLLPETSAVPLGIFFLSISIMMWIAYKQIIFENQTS